MKTRQEKFDERAARRYWHMHVTHRPCYRGTSLPFCLSCFWREITGANRREVAAFIKRADEMEKRLRRD